MLAVVLIIGGISWAVNNAHKSHRNSSGAISKGGNLDAISLHAGDCFLLGEGHPVHPAATNAQPQCENAAKTKVDQSKLPQNAQPSMLFADSSTWSQGYHDILCVYENDTDFTGSILTG